MAESSILSVLALIDKTIANVEDLAPEASSWRNDEVEGMLREIRNELNAFEVARAERAPRQRVSDPIVLPSSRYVFGLLVRPCSRKHRLLFLQGFLVLSCSKCSLERLEDAEVSSV